MNERVQFDGGIPPEVRAIIAPYFPMIERLAPPWCSRVWVKWESTCEAVEGCKACTLTRYEYRYGAVTFHGLWLDCTEEERRDTVAHESMHLYVQQLDSFTARMIETLAEEKAAEVARESLRMHSEAVVQDLALLVMRLNV